MEKQISDYVKVIIDDEDDSYDVRIIDNFLERTESILPKEEAYAVAKYIIEVLENKLDTSSLET